LKPGRMCNGQPLMTSHNTKTSEKEQGGRRQVSGVIPASPTFSCGTCDGSLQLLRIPTACPPSPGGSPRKSCRAAPDPGPPDDRIPGEPPGASSHAEYPEDIPPPCSAAGRRHQIQVASSAGCLNGRPQGLCRIGSVPDQTVTPPHNPASLQGLRGESDPEPASQTLSETRPSPPVCFGL